MRLALYIFLCIVWGSTWLFIKVGYGGLGAFNVAALRFFVAGALFVPLVPLFRARWPRTREEWLLVWWVGLAMFAADYGLIYWSEQFIDSGLTAILFATMPLMTIFMAHAYLGSAERMTIRKLSGTVGAFLGVIVLFWDRARLDVPRTGPMAAVVVAAACAAGATVASKRHGAALHPAALNAPSMLIGGGMLLAVSLAVGDGFALPHDAATWGAVAYLAVVGSVLAFLAYFTLLKTWSVTSLSFITVFAPVVALLLGFIFLDERPTIMTAIGAVLILSGVALALTKS